MLRQPLKDGGRARQGQLQKKINSFISALSASFGKAVLKLMLAARSQPRLDGKQADHFR